MSKKQLQDKFDAVFASMVRFHVWTGFAMGTMFSVLAAYFNPMYILGLSAVGWLASFYYFRKTNKEASG